jgi:hypothetical protein
MADKPDEVLFSLVAGAKPEGPHTLLLEITLEQWVGMRHDGRGLLIDLTPAGAPLKVVVMACKDKAQGLKNLEAETERLVKLQQQVTHGQA